MALFGRRRDSDQRRLSSPGPSAFESHLLPGNIVELMTIFGEYEFNPMGSATDPGFNWNGISSPRLPSRSVASSTAALTLVSHFCAPLLPAAQSDTSEFLRRLSAAVLPAGGWAVFGGAHLVKELLSGDLDDPSYHAMLEASLDFLRGLGVPKSRLNGYESTFWSTHKGQTEPWIPTLPLPENPPLTPLLPGEERRIAQLEPGDASNEVYVRATADGNYEALIDARWSDQDPRRVRNVWQTAGSHYDLYRLVAESLQVPSHWADPELLPFFPYPPPKVDWLPGVAR